MNIDAIPEWTGDLEQLRRLQESLAARVVRRDDFPRPLRRVAGVHVRMETAAGAEWVDDTGEPAEGDPWVHATAVLLDADSLQLIATAAHREGARMPYQRGFRSFRELPALLAALAALPQAPDMVLVPAHGLAHPRRLGLASHLGLAAELPTIGVTDRVLLGHVSTTLHDMRGAFTTLRDERQQIGWLLRSKPGTAPLAVSPGHRVALPSAPELVMRWVREDRLPEPLRLAAELARPPTPDA
jgi:deoxyribonuclease V